MKRLLAALILMTPLLLLARPRQAQQTLKVNVDLVNVLFTVTDKTGHLVTGLKQEDIAVEEDGRKQDITSFGRENSLPLTIGMLIDSSASVSRVFQDEKDTALSFLDTVMRPSDLAFAIGFERSVTLVQDITDDRRKLRDAIEGLTIGQGTSINDAVYLACKDVLKTEGGRKAIILISDGQDTTSKLRVSEALVEAYHSDAVIYSISNRIGAFFNIKGNGDPDTLKRFSEETGGTVYFIGGRSDLTRVFEQIAQELRAQYSLGYTSSNTARDGKFRKIRIVAKDPSYQVKARTGYYAPTAGPI